ncbi:MAG: hypothetical protein D6731_11975 [Planctomycetota bacterium]|nr:MAG: hypothetical protein D6731_11975 [Planctomycetota bacterium]
MLTKDEQTTATQKGVRLAVWREVLCEDEVRFFTAEEVRVPCTVLLREGLGPLHFSNRRRPARSRRRKGRRQRSRSTRPQSGPALALRSQAGSRIEADAIVASTPYAFAQLLLHRELEVFSPELQNLLSAVRSAANDTEAAQEVLVRALEREEPALNQRAFRRFHRAEPLPRSPKGPVFLTRVFEELYPAEAEYEGATLRGTSLEGALLETTVVRNVCGAAIPRSVRVWVRGNEDAFVWDGERLTLPALSRLPAPVVEALDRGGRCSACPRGNVLPEQHLVARALLRVPSLPALNKALKASLRRPRHRVLSTPAFVRRSTDAIPLNRSVRVLDEPRLAAWVLTHLVDDFYLPDDRTPRTELDKRFAKEGYLVLCDLGLGA